MRKIKNSLLVFISLVLLCLIPYVPVSANAISTPVTSFAISRCGSGNDAVNTSINFGCAGSHCYPSVQSGWTSYCKGDHSAIVDLLFAIIRFLSDGVGLVLILSLIIAGIQYTTSRGEPQAINSATKRIQSTATALLVFVFAYAFLNYIIPNGFFGQ